MEGARHTGYIPYDSIDVELLLTSQRSACLNQGGGTRRGRDAE